MKSVNDLFRGIFRHPLKTGGYMFTAFSVIFTIVRAIKSSFARDIPTNAIRLSSSWSPFLVGVIPSTNPIRNTIL